MCASMNDLVKTCVVLLVVTVLFSAAAFSSAPEKTKKKPAAPKKDDPRHILDRLPKGTIIERDIVSCMQPTVLSVGLAFNTQAITVVTYQGTKH